MEATASKKNPLLKIKFIVVCYITKRELMLLIATLHIPLSSFLLTFLCGHHNNENLFSSSSCHRMDGVRISFFSENWAQKLLTGREHTPPDQLWNIVQPTNNDFTLLLLAQTLANLVEYVPTSNSTALATS